MPRGVYDHSGNRPGPHHRGGYRHCEHKHATRRQHIWVKKAANGLRPVVDPDAKCYLCEVFGAEWYGEGGRPVHVKCWRKFIEGKAKPHDGGGSLTYEAERGLSEG